MKQLEFKSPVISQMGYLKTFEPSQTPELNALN